VAGEVVAFAQEDREPTAGGVGGYADPIDTAADHGNVINLGEWAGGVGHGHLLENERVYSNTNIVAKNNSIS